MYWGISVKQIKTFWGRLDVQGVCEPSSTLLACLLPSHFLLRGNLPHTIKLLSYPGARR